MQTNKLVFVPLAHPDVLVEPHQRHAPSSTEPAPDTARTYQWMMSRINGVKRFTPPDLSVIEMHAAIRMFAAGMAFANFGEVTNEALGRAMEQISKRAELDL